METKPSCHLHSKTEYHPNDFIQISQVCDGVIDCPDMSDECLCRHPASTAVNNLCASVCWNRIWSGSSERPAHCEICDIGETLSAAGIDKDTFPGSGAESDLTCVNSNAICTSNTDSHRQVCLPQTQVSPPAVIHALWSICFGVKKGNHH